jgi:hypothetical protein
MTLRAFSNYLSITWVNIIKSILHYICVAVFVIKEVVLSICYYQSVGSESSKRGVVRDSNNSLIDIIVITALCVARTYSISAGVPHRRGEF